jgi:hypothetical protein
MAALPTPTYLGGGDAMTGETGALGRVQRHAGVGTEIFVLLSLAEHS